MIKIAVQGEKSTFSDIAAIKYFGKNILFSPSFNINKVFEKVRHLNHLSKISLSIKQFGTYETGQMYFS